MANKKYKLANNDYWATDGVFDFGQSKTQREINSDLNGALNDRVMLRKNAKIFTTAIQGGNLLLFGDSWAEGYRSTSGNDFGTKLALRLGMTRINYGAGNSGFISDGHLISAQITSAANALTQEQKNQTSVIVILGGINDYRTKHTTASADDFATGVISTLTTACSSFPNIPIVICLGNTYVSPPPGAYYEWIDVAVAKIRSTIFANSVHVIYKIPELLCGQSSLYYNGDTLHPNDDGYNVLAGYVYNVMMGGNDTIYRELGSLTPDSGITFSTPSSLYQIDRVVTLTSFDISFGGNNKSSKWLATLPNTVYSPANIINLPAFSNRNLVGTVEINNSGRLAFYTSAAYFVAVSGSAVPVTTQGIETIRCSELKWMFISSWAV